MTPNQTAREAFASMRSIRQKAELEGREFLTAAETAERDRLADVVESNTVHSSAIERSGGELGMVTGRALAPANPGFARFLKHGDTSEMRAAGDTEQRALGVGTGSAGGYLVPQGFRSTLIETMKSYGGIRQLAAHVDSDNGADLPWPTVDDTANEGAILAENTQVTEQDVVLGTATLEAYMYTSKMVRVSLQLIQDSGFDAESWLAGALATRIGRVQNRHFTTGTGTAQPLGIVTGATVGVTAASATAITYDELVDLESSVDPAYRTGPGVGWMMSSGTLSALRKMKDADDRPLLQPDVQAGAPRNLLGYPTFVNNHMPDVAVDAKTVLFGNFRAGFVIRDVNDVSLLRLAERYADYLQVGFLAFLRSDGLVQDPAAYKALVMAAA